MPVVAENGLTHEVSWHLAQINRGFFEQHAGWLRELGQPGVGGVFFRARQASEQYFTSSQFFAQALRQLMGLPQTAQGLLGRWALLPLNGWGMGVGGVDRWRSTVFSGGRWLNRAGPAPWRCAPASPLPGAPAWAGVRTSGARRLPHTGRACSCRWLCAGPGPGRRGRRQWGR
jgi:hypothetical protein